MAASDPSQFDASHLVREYYDEPMQEFANTEGFALDEIERNSKLWRKIDKYLRDSLQMQREKNDTHLNEVETASIRGNIQRIKEILAIGKAPVPEEDPDDPDLGY